MNINDIAKLAGVLKGTVSRVINNNPEGMSDKTRENIRKIIDTDCNGATVGTILGMLNGYQGIEAKWLDGLKPVLNTSIQRYTQISLDEIAERTLILVNI